MARKKFLDLKMATTGKALGVGSSHWGYKRWSCLPPPSRVHQTAPAALLLVDSPALVPAPWKTFYKDF